jgi:hypothetical protein
MADFEVEDFGGDLPGTDGTPLEPIQDLVATDTEGFEFLEGGEEVLPGEEVAEESYLDGRFKTAEEMEQYINRIEQERALAQDDLTVQDLREFGINLDAIPTAKRQQFDLLCREFLGMDINQAASRLARGEKAIRIVESKKGDAVKQTYINELKAEWGDNFDFIFKKVNEEFSQLTPEEQRVYNQGTKGAKLLGAKYQLALLQGKMAATPSVPNARTEPRLKSTVPSKQLSGQPQTYSLAAIEAKALRDPAWYERNAKAIGLLHKAGRLT